MSDFLLMRIVLFTIMLACGVFLIWAARAAASGRLTRNMFVGIRTPSTLASDEAWQTAHVRARRPGLLSGVAALATALVTLLPVSRAVMVGAVFLGCLVVFVLGLHATRMGSRAAREVTQPGSSSEVL